MRIIECVQGDPVWINARLGLPTASNFDRIITPTGKPSAQAPKYLAKLVAEWFLGESLDDYQSGFMERGTELEPQARAFYEFDTEQTVREVGLCLTDFGNAGCSPDGLVGDDGGLEIKTPSAEVHMGYVIGGMPTDYFVQVQGCLWVTGRSWWDLQAWNPALPKVRVRYHRDEKFINALAVEVDAFADRLSDAREKLADEKAKRDEGIEEAALVADHQF